MEVTKVLVVDDNREICSLIKKFGERSFNYSITVAHTINEAIDELKKNSYQIITLDIEFEDESGLERIVDIKRYFGGPIIFLSCIDTIESIVEGLKKGADDYITKPFDLDELFLRINRSLVRAGSYRILEVENYKIDEIKNIVTQNDIQLDLSDIATRILIMLLKNKDTVLTREKIFKAIWETDYTYSTRVIDTHISHIRKETEDGRIRSIRGKGYCFETK